MLAGVPSDDYQGRLYRLCKVWGYVKYHHSKVSACQVNWDSVLLATVPLVKAATNQSQFNTAVLQMLDAAGPMDLATSPPAYVDSSTIVTLVNFDWLNDPYFSQAVRDKLDTIKTNFRPHSSCFIDYYFNVNPNGQSWYVFPGDTFYNIPAGLKTEPVRLLEDFRFWNQVYYFYPNTNILDIPWDSTLLNNVMDVANPANYHEYLKTVFKIFHDLNDSHTGDIAQCYVADIPKTSYYYYPPVIINHVENKYVVAYSADSTMHKGDIIDSVDGYSMTNWEDSIRPYLSESNDARFHYDIFLHIISGNQNTYASFSFTDSLGNKSSASLKRNKTYTFFTSQSVNSLLGTDTTTEYKTLDCGVGYVSLRNLKEANMQAMYDSLWNKPAIIFDARSYLQISIFNLAYTMFATPTQVANFLEPDLSVPGRGNWYHIVFGSDTNRRPYTGLVVLLMNEKTQSASEYACMVLSQNQHAIKVGSQTAGSDGNISAYLLDPDILAAFSSIGVYTPAGTNTQRLGIVPDVEVHPTLYGFRKGIDEVLDSAIAIACNYNAVENIPTPEENLNVYPNPGNNYLMVEAPNNNTSLRITIVNLLGQTLLQQDMATTKQGFDVSAIPKGLFFVAVYSKNGHLLKTTKWVKE